MTALVIVKVKIIFDAVEQGISVGIFSNVEVFVFDASPQSFDPDIVDASSSSIHTDSYLFAVQLLCKGMAGVLTALVAVEDFGLTVEKGILEGLDTKVTFQRIGQPPSKNKSGEPVHNCDQIEEASFHWNISNIAAPNMIGMGNGSISQKIRKHPIFQMRA